jgi:zinc-binding alcohol dehydrogenase family protein
VSLTPAQAAALPLTMLTAWELLFDRFRLAEGGHAGASLLVVGGAGGVGSAMIQLARALTGMTVIASASRPETRDWCLSLGAHHVVDHRGDMPAQVAALGAPPCTHVAILSGTAANLPAVAEVVAPQGAIGLIDDPPLDASAQGLLKRKSVSLHWEFMFTRPMARTPDMAAQGAILSRVAALVDQGRLRSTLTRDMGRMTPDTLRAAHAAVETGQTIGKVVLTVG